MKYIIPGQPIPLARPRFYNGKAYDPQSNSKRAMGSILKLLHNNHIQYDGAVHLHVDFFMGLPPSWSAKKKKYMDGLYHTQKPDLSNLLKWIEDCATGICYKDDCLVVSVSGTKCWSSRARTELTITEITNENIDNENNQEL